MSHSVRLILRSLLAVVAGYAVIVVGTTLTFEALLGGIGYHESSTGELLVAGAGAALSGLAGGLVAGLLAPGQPFAHAAGVLIFLVLDTVYVVTTFARTDPLWFDLAGSATLMVCALAGGYLIAARDRRRATAAG